MAKAEPDDDVVETPVVEPIKSRSRLYILLAFSVVVLLEMILLVWFLPAPAGTSTVQEEPVPTFVPDPPVKLGDLVEKPIPGPFNASVSAEDGITGYMVSAQFTMKCEQKKASRYDTLYDKVKDKIRAEILTILRSSKVEDIIDPNCTTIRNRILMKINEIFAEPQPIIKEVIAVDFRYTPT